MATRTVLFGVLVVGVVLGLVVGSGGASLFGLANADTSTPTESYSLSSGSGCSNAPQSGGWVGQQTVGGSTAIAFNYTVVHEATAADVNATLDSDGNGDYIFHVRTGPDRDASAEKGPAPDGCQPSTTINAGISVPRTYETVTIVVDGKTVTTIENDGATTARYHLVSGTS